ncbi:hypothetical protein VTK56DRAFT_4414 [Thermocarpiscus australiensis]
MTPDIGTALARARAKGATARSSSLSPRLVPVRRKPSEDSLPSEVLPTDVLPTEVLPTEVLPTEVLPTEVVAPTHTSLSIDPTLALAPTSPPPTTSSSHASQTAVQHTTTSALRPTATAKASSETDSGELSTVAKAGIVMGVLAGLLVVFVLVYYIITQRKKKLERRRQQIEDDEKINGPFSDSAAIRSPTTAPRLSLRPITQLYQFLPNFTSQSQAEKRASRGIALTLNPVRAPSPTTSLSPLHRPVGGSAWERPTMSSTVNGPAFNADRPQTSSSVYPNPFNDGHRIHDEPVSPVSSMSSFDHRVGVATTTDSIPEPVSPIGGEDENAPTASSYAAANLTRKASIRKDLPKPLDLTKPPSPLYAMPPSPTGTEYSMHSMSPGQFPGPSASAAAIAAAGGPTQSTVHRVQLDFKPTLADEMELRAGQLVRLLHEYDDGWALCIRLDRSQQGVVPRTCLSTRPVKPRPPQGTGGGGGPPVSLHNHSHNHSGRPASPSIFPSVPKGRTPSPGGRYQPSHQQGRPHSPHGPKGRRASPSGRDRQQQQYRGHNYPRQGGRWQEGMSGVGPAPGQAY